ncbi:maltodextrin glucosidase [Acidothermaceae bacterium B102]|nr:maltodextrin glucosidase [Acidothermaceae bacterium B102]
MSSSATAWRQPHHDGSPLYVSNPNPKLGDTVAVFLRAPHPSGVSQAHVRVVVDGEPAWFNAHVDRTDAVETWYRADISVANPIASYRWLIDGGTYNYRWVTGAGVVEHDVTDATDFKLTTFAPPPTWADDAVVYHIFPDRFARSTSRPAPAWAIPQAWDDPVVGDGALAALQWYGGDLDGVVMHLDHLQSLSVNTVYLTPIFPAGSNHRYDAASFDTVDPLLGGDDALARLSDALHARGMRLIGDLTTNHAGVTHAWFEAAVADRSAAEAGYFIFREHPGDYLSWLDVPSLPKLNHQDARLRELLYEGPDSVVAQWLRPPGNLDGWRIDVANMTGRHGDVDLNHDVALAIRATMTNVAPDALLLAEHGHDYTQDVMGDGWHGTMNYSGFARPIWSWLRAPDHSFRAPTGAPIDLPRIAGEDMVATMRAFTAGVPWDVTRHNLTILSSHDSPRAMTVLGAPELVAVAAGLMATLPGIPSLYAGDEIGLEGVNGEDGRRPFPWDAPETWDGRLLAAWRGLLGLRTQLQALRTGGMRWLHVGADCIVFIRELADQCVLVQATRSSAEPVTLPAQHFGGGRPWTGLLGAADLAPNEYEELSLPNDGPAIRLWLLP